MLAYASFRCIRGKNCERFVQVAINLYIERGKTRDKRKENNMNKGNKKILLAAMTAAIVLVAMCGIGSAGYIGVSKNTVPPFATYRIGETVAYYMTVELTGSPPVGHSIDVVAYDTYPNGTKERMTCTLTNGSVEVVPYTRTYVVDAADIIDGVYDPYIGDDVILNVFNATGYNTSTGNPTGDEATTPCQSKILRDPSANFDFDAGDCDLTVEFTPTATDPDGTIDSYFWDFDHSGVGSTETRTNANPFTHTFPATGDYSVNLTVTDNDGLTDWIVKTVHITAPPEVTVKASPSGQVAPGTLVTFSINSLTYDAPIATYAWTFSDGGSGSSDNTDTTTRTIPEGGVTAYLTVTDTVGCSGTANVRVYTDPVDVPILTPAGLLALIGMLGIVGAGRIITNGKRGS